VSGYDLCVQKIFAWLVSEPLFQVRHWNVYRSKPAANTEIPDLRTIELALLVSRSAIVCRVISSCLCPGLLGPLQPLDLLPSAVNIRKITLKSTRRKKRIDITFDNGAPRDGFFFRLQHAFDIPCQYIIFECKNYTEDVANAELDQLTGRLSPNRGKFGVIVCRDIEDEPLFIQRCADSYKAQRGLIVPLTDADIVKILEARKVGTMHLEDEILSDKSRRVMNI